MPEPPSPSARAPLAARRRPIRADAEWVRGERLFAGTRIPFVLRPQVDGMDLAEWAAAHRGLVDQMLLEHRALLFRGFGIDSVPRFAAVVRSMSDGQPLEYRDRTTPRTTEGDRIYTATVHPQDQRIHDHNEGTYWIRWAMRLHFCCVTAPEQGGETPLADVRSVLARIAPAVRERFAEHGFRLVRNYNDGFGLRWQEVFQTEDRAEVEAFCRQNRIELAWKGGDRLRTSQVRPALRRHPATGEPVWFNHAAFYHWTGLEPDVREALLAAFGVEGLPYNTTYGDGRPIEPEAIAHIRAAWDAERVMFPWQAGDLLLLDNMTVSHARQPFQGPRKVLVSMTDAVDEQACRLAGQDHT